MRNEFCIKSELGNRIYSGFLTFLGMSSTGASHSSALIKTIYQRYFLLKNHTFVHEESVHFTLYTLFTLFIYTIYIQYTQHTLQNISLEYNNTYIHKYSL